MRVSELDASAMCGLWWPSDESWLPHFNVGREFRRQGAGHPPCPGADTYGDVMQNQGFLYEQALQKLSRG